MELLKFYMHHTCCLNFGVSWSSVGEANNSIYMTQSGLENTVLLEKKNNDSRFSEMIGESLKP